MKGRELTIKEVENLKEGDRVYIVPVAKEYKDEIGEAKVVYDGNEKCLLSVKTKSLDSAWGIDFYNENTRRQIFAIYEWIENKEQKQFTKSDLKTGMWVEYRNGDKRMVVIDSINGDVFVSSEGYVCIKDYNNNLTMETYRSDLDIVKVFEPKTFCSMYRGDDLKLIWQRSEEPKNKIEKPVIRTFTYNGETVTLVHKENKTTVRLQDNTKGMARCSEEDVFDRDKGLEIAYLRAKEKQIKSKIGELVK